MMEKLEFWKERERVNGKHVERINRGRKDHCFGWGCFKMVENSSHKDLEGGMRWKRMWKLIPQVGGKNKRNW